MHVHSRDVMHAHESAYHMRVMGGGRRKKLSIPSMCDRTTDWEHSRNFCPKGEGSSLLANFHVFLLLLLLPAPSLCASCAWWQVLVITCYFISYRRVYPKRMWLKRQMHMTDCSHQQRRSRLYRSSQVCVSKHAHTHTH